MKKLNDEEVYEIKTLIKQNIPAKQIAAKFNVSESTISRIKKNELHSDIVAPSKDYLKGYKDGWRDCLAYMSRNCDN